MLAALEEFAIEASILKVASSEMIDFVVDENVQIHGGNGFVHDYPAERTTATRASTASSRAPTRSTGC